MQVFKDTILFIKTLSFVDILFFMAVLVLMLLIITLIYFVKEGKDEDIEAMMEEEEEKEDIVNKDKFDLQEVMEALENAPASTVNLNQYEEEQEEKAIISYEELLKHKNDFALNYSEEENIDDDLTIKKVDLDNLVNKEVEIKPSMVATVISYEKEEAFLKALKTLQQKLN